jgi:CheY-like chemotaxis protein
MRQRLHPYILVADDEEDMRAIVRHVLEPLPALIFEAASGLELIKAFARPDPFDLVVTDVRMPWANGLQVATSVRVAGIATPLIVMSAFGDDVLRKSVLNLGNTMFLDKPFHPQALRSAVEAMLHQVPSRPIEH